MSIKERMERENKLTFIVLSILDSQEEWKFETSWRLKSRTRRPNQYQKSYQWDKPYLLYVSQTKYSPTQSWDAEIAKSLHD